MHKTLESLVAKAIYQVVANGARVAVAARSVLVADPENRKKLNEYFAPVIEGAKFGNTPTGSLTAFVADMVDAGRCLWSYHADYREIPEEELDENQGIYWWVKQGYDWATALIGVHRDPGDPDYFVGALFDDALILANEFGYPLDLSTGCARVHFPYSDIKMLERSLLDKGFNVSVNDFQHNAAYFEDLNFPHPEDDPDYDQLGGRADPRPGPCGGPPKCHISILSASLNELSDAEKGFRMCLPLARIAAQKYRSFKAPEPLPPFELQITRL